MRYIRSQTVNPYAVFFTFSGYTKSRSNKRRVRSQDCWRPRRSQLCHFYVQLHYPVRAEHGPIEKFAAWFQGYSKPHQSNRKETSFLYFLSIFKHRSRILFFPLLLPHTSRNGL